MDERLRRTLVGPDDSIRRTMQAIDETGTEIALVVAGDGRMVGTISDGDIRRALLGGAALDDAVGPFAEPHFSWVGADADRAGVLDLMRARSIAQVPVLDDAGRVVGLHLLAELIGSGERPNAAVVMAGGRGSRLRPYTDGLPKPMVTVAGRPILERIVLHLVGSGVRTVYLAVNYLREVIEDHFGDGSGFGCRVEYLREDVDRPLGTGGALALLPEEVRSSAVPILVMNGDLVAQFHVGRLIDAHEASGNVATVGVREYVHEIPFGVVTVDGDHLVDLQEKPAAAWAVNAGVYLLDPRLVERVPSDREFPITELLAACLLDGEKVGVHHLDGEWVDVGRPDELRRARGE